MENQQEYLENKKRKSYGAHDYDVGQKILA